MNEIAPLPGEEALKRWNEFTQSASARVPFSFNPSFFYFYREYFHWKPYYFILYRQDKPVGVFPLVNTGKAFVSLPHFSYGGLFTQQPVPDAASIILGLTALISKSSLPGGFYRYDLSSETRPERNIVNASLFLRGLNPPGGIAIPEKESSYIELPPTIDELWLRLSSNLRRKIRKANKSGFVFRIGGEELLKDFYHVYSRKMHQLGSPPYGKGFFRSFFHTSLEERLAFFVAYSGSLPVGGALLLSYKGFYESAWFATKPSFHKYYVSDGLHWAMIQYVIKNGGRIYSMGRSTKNGSVYIYKNHWPVENSPLFLYNFSSKLSLRNYSWLSKIWKCVPVPVANLWGQSLVKHIY